MSGVSLAQANADVVTDFLLVGGDLSFDLASAAAEAAQLVRAGVTLVIDCREEAVEELWAGIPAVTYRWDGIDDAGQRVPAAWFTRITDAAHTAIRAGGVVLTHCHMGINRGPRAGFAVLLREDWDPVDALDAIRAARPIAVMAYAEDALEWHLDRIGADEPVRHDAHRRVRRWRAANPLPMSRALALSRAR